MKRPVTYFAGTGRAAPPKVVTNNDFAALGLETSHEWIVERTGISERRIAGPGESTCSLAAEAARQAMQRAHDWFQEQLGGLANQVREAEAALEQYRSQHGLIDLPDDGTSGASRTTSVVRQQLSEVTSQLAQVSRERAQKEAKLSQARAVVNGKQVGHIGTLPEVLMSPGVLQLLNQETTVAAKEAQLAASEGPGNPELIAVRA